MKFSPPALRACLVETMSAWLVKTRGVPSRHCRDARVYGHKTTAMHDIGYTPPLPLLIQQTVSVLALLAIIGFVCYTQHIYIYMRPCSPFSLSVRCILPRFIRRMDDLSTVKSSDISLLVKGVPDHVQQQRICRVYAHYTCVCVMTTFSHTQRGGKPPPVVVCASLFPRRRPRWPIVGGPRAHYDQFRGFTSH